MIEKFGDFTFTDEYWTCDCVTDYLKSVSKGRDYIRPASLKRCEKCGAEQKHQPFATLDEVQKAGLPVKDMREKRKPAVEKPKKPQYTKASKLLEKFKETRYAEKTTVQQYLDMLETGMEKGITGDEYTYFAGRVFSAILLDIHFNRITDRVLAKDETASVRVFKKAMRKALGKNGTPRTHYLYRQ